MSDSTHVRQIDAKVTALSTALAHLGRGTSLAELLKIIHFPGWTTPAEFALVTTIVDSMAAHAAALAKAETSLLAAAKLVNANAPAHA